MAKRYYITTPIYYVNSVPHIGTTVTTLASDVVARYQKMRGQNVCFLTGTDENGIKVMEAAQKAGEAPQAFVDRISQEFKKSWSDMNILYDDFIRTTEERHVQCVKKLFEVIRDKGYIYEGVYEGWYDVSTETFYKESDLVDGKSPEGNEVRWVEEKNWFFKLSAFGDKLLQHLESHPDFIVPASRTNEVVSFIKQGLRDMCITRTNQGWGITVPGDESKVFYVWFDALINYVSATGWPNEGWQDLWPSEVQWMAKDILTRFHATLWPAILMAADLPLPLHLVGHGYINFGGEKISKSKGNVVHPVALAKQLSERSGCEPKIGVDGVRYYLAATMPYETDSTYTEEEFERRYNADLANDLGNALNRSLAMAHKFADGTVPEAATEQVMIDAIRSAKKEFDSAMDGFRVDHATAAAWGLVRFLNKYIDTRAPWALAKSADPALGGVLRSMLIALRATEGLIRPILPWTADDIAGQLSLEATTSWESIGDESSLPSGTRLCTPKPIFPRLELKPAPPLQKEAKEKEKKEKVKKGFEPPAEIEFTDFMKVQLKVARIVEAEPVEGSEKLLKMQVMLGDEKRQIVAGIRKSYPVEDLVGRQVIVVANLKPATLMGHESQGMVLAADGPDGSAILLAPEAEAPEGASVH